MICVLWGEDKSCKSTMALSFPRPLVNMEFDIGGFNRACRNIGDLKIKDWKDTGEITNQQYIMPMQLQLDSAKQLGPSKIVIGIKELWYEFATGFIKNVQNPDVQTIVVDTGTLLYELTCTGYLQEKQELQMPLRPDGKGSDNKALRVSLLPIEYREPYIRMRGFLHQAKAYRKNLVLTHHAADEYGLIRLRDGGMGEGKTGKRVLHGWTQLGDGADIITHNYWDKTLKKPMCEVELAGDAKELEGMVFQEPTYDKLVTTIKMMRGEG